MKVLFSNESLDRDERAREEMPTTWATIEDQKPECMS